MKKIINYFLYWRVSLFVVAALAIRVISIFGDRFPYADTVLKITGLPSWIWGFGNFDGVHYLRIAQNGYTAQFTRAFFPLYPLLIRIANFFPRGNLDLRIYTDPGYFYTGTLLSPIFFIPALYFLFRLWSEEYNQKVANLGIILLLAFPTAFYFGAIYSEALFLLLVVLVFWFTKKGNLLLAGVFAALASATKIQGALLVIFLAIELWNKPKKYWTDFLGVVVSPLGLITYMVYLKQTMGDSLYFLTSQPLFGAARSSLPIILLPQVIYRYIKIFLSVPITSLAFFNAGLEFTVTAIVVIWLVWAFKKVKLSYWVFVVLAVIMPTLTGTLSSMPRYVLLAFPLLPLIATRLDKAVRYIVIVQGILQILLLALYIRGYWVA